VDGKRLALKLLLVWWGSQSSSLIKVRPRLGLILLQCTMNVKMQQRFHLLLFRYLELGGVTTSSKVKVGDVGLELGAGEDSR
jgi:hypothetical protein